MLQKEKGRLTFWASRYDCMNDPDDCKLGIEALNQYDSELLPEPYYPYVVSFSESIDDFYLWQCYRADICLVFQMQALDDIEGWKLFECTYEDDMQIAIERDVEDITALDYSEIGRYISKYKRKDFANEKEFRLVAIDEAIAQFQNGEFYDGEVAKGVKGRITKKIGICLYKEVGIPSAALSEIWVHIKDKQDFLKIQERILLLLKSNGIFIQKEQIKKSQCAHVDY